MQQVAFEREYSIHYYDIDCRGNVFVTSLMNFLEDVSMLQSEHIGVDSEYFRKHCKAWVLYKWDIKINKLPKYREKIKVKTVPYAFNRFYAYRRFYITDKRGEEILSAKSIWLLIDTAKKRPIKVTEDMYELYQVKSFEPWKIKRIQRPSSIDIEKEFQVRYSDIDTNQHANNVKYIEWALETVPLDILLNRTITNLKAEYRKETTYGKTVKVLTQTLNKEENITCLHNIVDEDNKQLCLLETQWEV